MKRIKYYLIPIIILILAFGIFRTSNDTNIKNYQSKEDFIEKQMNMGIIRNSQVAVTDREKVLYQNSFGDGVKNNTEFRVGSITKSFTALSIRQLINEGKLKEDALVIDYIPWFDIGGGNSETKITIKNLLNFESGINRNTVNLFEDNRESFIRNLKDAMPNREVGVMQYPSVDYEILSYLIETISGITYEEYVQKNICEPLELNNTYFSREENNLIEGYDVFFGINRMLKGNENIIYGKAFWAGGHIATTSEDLAKFTKVWLNDGNYEGGNITHKTLENDKTYDLNKWIEVKKDDMEGKFFSGTTKGYTATLYLDYKEGIVSIALTNVSNEIPGIESPTSRTLAEGLYNFFSDNNVSVSGKTSLTRVYFIIISVLLLFMALMIYLTRRIYNLNKINSIRLIILELIQIIIPIVLLILFKNYINLILGYKKDVGFIIIGILVSISIFGIIKLVLGLLRAKKLKA